MGLRIKLDEILKNRGLNQKQLSEMTGIRPAAISELFNNQRKSISREHLEKIISVLNIDDLNEILEYKKGDSQ